MKKLFNYTGLILLIGLLSTTACEEDDYINHQATEDNKPVVSNTGATAFNLKEGETCGTATISLEIDKPTAATIFLTFRPLSGNISRDDVYASDETTEDLHVGGPNGYIIEIPPYSTEYSFDFYAVRDTELENAKSGQFELAPINNRAAVTTDDRILYDISIAKDTPITAAPFIGTATVVVDEWADYSPGDSVEIEAGANEHEFLIRSYSNPAISNPNTAYMVVTIDPLSGNVTVVSNEDFEYGCSEGDVIGTGSVDICQGAIDLVLDFGLGDCGDYSGNALTLQL